jgi:hypothetical protein
MESGTLSSKTNVSASTEHSLLRGTAIHEIAWIKMLWDDYHGANREKALGIIEALKHCTLNVSTDPGQATYVLATTPYDIRLSVFIKKRRPHTPRLIAEIPGVRRVYVNMGRHQKAAALWFALQLPPFNRNP